MQAFVKLYKLNYRNKMAWVFMCSRHVVDPVVLLFICLHVVSIHIVCNIILVV